MSNGEKTRRQQGERYELRHAEALDHSHGFLLIGLKLHLLLLNLRNIPRGS
jgi:hypothetical protein